MASNKLRELQMQIEAKGQELQREISTEASRFAGPDHNHGGGGGGGGGSGAAAYDPEEAAHDERRALLRRQQKAGEASAGARSAVPIKKIAIIVGATALAAVVLLLVLFWRASPESPVEESIEEEARAGSIPVDERGCPERSAIPKACQTRDRLKNMSVFDTCKELFEKHGWDVANLKSCGLIA